jgi:hypothetical protein
MVADQKELIDSLKLEWKMLWQERLDDKVRAEGVAINDYSSLFVDKGTIIHATRDFKALNFREILEQHEVRNIERYISPDPHVGGWGRFVKDNFANNQSLTKKRAQQYIKEKSRDEKKTKKQPKKNGRGWLHK